MKINLDNLMPECVTNVTNKAIWSLALNKETPEKVALVALAAIGIIAGAVFASSALLAVSVAVLAGTIGYSCVENKVKKYMEHRKEMKSLAADTKRIKDEIAAKKKAQEDSFLDNQCFERNTTLRNLSLIKRQRGFYNPARWVGYTYSPSAKSWL